MIFCMANKFINVCQPSRIPGFVGIWWEKCQPCRIHVGTWWEWSTICEWSLVFENKSKLLSLDSFLLVHVLIIKLWLWLVVFLFGQICILLCEGMLQKDPKTFISHRACPINYSHSPLYIVYTGLHKYFNQSFHTKCSIYLLVFTFLK